MGLGGHRHEGELVRVAGLLQADVAQLPVVYLPGLVAAVLPPGRAADGAHRLLHRAGHADLLLDAPLNLRDEALVVRGAHHIGVPLQPAVGVPRLGKASGLRHHLGAVEPGRLALGAPVVVKDAALAHKQGGQLLQGPGGKPLPVPVHLVVAQAHREGVHLRLRQRRAAEAVDVLQVPRLKDRLGLLGCFDDLHVVSLLICSVWA